MTASCLTMSLPNLSGKVGGLAVAQLYEDLYYSIAKYAAKYIAMNADGTWYAIADGDAAK